MRVEEIRRMRECEDTYWWFVGRRYILGSWLCGLRERLPCNPQIVDIGCGTGGNALLLAELGPVTGVDAEQAALEYCEERGLRDLRLCKAQNLDLPDSSFDLATSFEVFEHIEEDDLAAAEAYRVLRPGGRLLLTVPAYPWLWSEHDEALSHRRRYGRSQLLALLRGAGFHVERVSYCVCFLLPITVLYRTGQRIRALFRRRPPEQPQSGLVLLPRPISALFAWTLWLEAVLLKVVNLPWGVTLIAEARKPNAVEKVQGLVRDE